MSNWNSDQPSQIQQWEVAYILMRLRLLTEPAYRDWGRRLKMEWKLIDSISKRPSWSYSFKNPRPSVVHSFPIEWIPSILWLWSSPPLMVYISVESKLLWLISRWSNVLFAKKKALHDLAGLRSSLRCLFLGGNFSIWTLIAYSFLYSCLSFLSLSFFSCYVKTNGDSLNSEIIFNCLSSSLMSSVSCFSMHLPMLHQDTSSTLSCVLFKRQSTRILPP